jgi:hypothetical protein
MSLNWNWDKKIGELTWKYRLSKDEEWKRTQIDLYEGNAFLIMINEYKEDGKEMYTLWSFWADETHAKRMLGLDKKWKDTYGKNTYVETNGTITRIRINKAKSRNWQKIVKLMSEAFDDIQIELYTKEDK